MEEFLPPVRFVMFIILAESAMMLLASIRRLRVILENFDYLMCYK
jgi:hypothetical protein